MSVKISSSPEQTNTCSKSRIETLEKGIKNVKS